MAFKKGDLSINIVIIAVIALLVLVVLSYIFVGKISQTRKGIDKCENSGAVCKGFCELDERKLEKDCNNNGNTDYNEGALIDGVCCLKV
ncbi:hypothetical protein COV19_06460 [Candidatus Woesearchaeota archaeon CG10_big_fil_rev_8_21_14_0_10_44_13]|nr:MAG: hypothetical protein COV19_06460 [Candidatus Woesearchaeota archaeon CG10_big_fil_rev_8_21_14_0_10_44_13]